MLESLPGYDTWKLASPPEDDDLGDPGEIEDEEYERQQEEQLEPEREP